MSVKEGTPSSNKYVAKQKSSQQFEDFKTLTDEEMAKKIMANFHTYVNKEVIPEEGEEEETKSTQSKPKFSA